MCACVRTCAIVVLQVHALLEQLQELLRRAEVERDKAKLQLKRHRVSFHCHSCTCLTCAGVWDLHTSTWTVARAKCPRAPAFVPAPRHQQLHNTCAMDVC